MREENTRWIRDSNIVYPGRVNLIYNTDTI